MELVSIEKNPDKEVFAVRINGAYHGAVTGENEIYLTAESFESPLKASNNARALKKKHQIKTDIKKFETFKKSPAAPKIVRSVYLYTEAEMASITHLRFREAWVIVSPTGDFVIDPKRPGMITEYVKTKEKAKIFPSYEAANLRLKTLDMVVKRGHTLQRFFVEANGFK